MPAIAPPLILVEDGDGDGEGDKVAGEVELEEELALFVKMDSTWGEVQVEG